MKGHAYIVPALGLLLAGASLGQMQYGGANVTGQLVSIGTVNLKQISSSATKLQARTAAAFSMNPLLDGHVFRHRYDQETSAVQLSTARRDAQAHTVQSLGPAAVPLLPVSTTFSGTGFNGLTHYDQRQANNGNQFSIEPPSPSIATGNGYVLQGVNDAIQVYTTSGAPVLPAVLASNQVFGLAPAIDRSTGVNGVYLTDMRVFYDHGIDRWFIVQRSQDNDVYGNPLKKSHLYMAVSQTGDPAGTYSIYRMDTTHASNMQCPCIADYPQLGADQYGFYISANEYNAFYLTFVDATIWAVSKASLAAGASQPTAYQFVIPRSTGLEFAIQPATTPPGASYFVGNNGVEYFASTLASGTGDSGLGVWAMTNTASLATSTPSPTLLQSTVPIVSYYAPDAAPQRPGPLPYGATKTGVLPLIDGGDTRTQSAVYAGGRLYVTLATQVLDSSGKAVTGAAYAILSPTVRAGVLSAFVLRQGYLAVNGNHLLRPTVAVGWRGRGAIAFTLVGRDYYPSAAFVPIDLTATGTTVQVAAGGVGPEDGFTGYRNDGAPLPEIARWGDYSTAVAANDGSIWMIAEYIPNAPRTPLANWGTFIINYVP
jgi:hypothetical protein